MKKGDRGLWFLAVLTAAAPLCVCGLWLADLAWNGPRTLVIYGITIPLSVCGAVISLVGAALVAVLLTTVQRRQTAEQEEQDTAMALQEKAHKRELEQVRSACRQEMEAFRSSLSHSLRMPVAIIQGYAELLAGGMVTNPQVQKEYLEKIVQRSQYMSDVMSRHFSAEEAIDSGNLSYGKLDLLELVRQVAADIQAAAREQNVAVQVVSPEEALPMTADAYLLNRAMFNLLENSLKYMGRPGVVTIRVLRNGEQVSILVQDDGLGLSAEETEHIFERQFQGSNRTDGGGYGLYLVKQTVEAHGGTISAQSAPGRGMGITAVIPLQPAREGVSA